MLTRLIFFKASFHYCRLSYPFLRPTWIVIFQNWFIYLSELKPCRIFTSPTAKPKECARQGPEGLKAWRKKLRIWAERKKFVPGNCYEKESGSWGSLRVGCIWRTVVLGDTRNAWRKRTAFPRPQLGDLEDFWFIWGSRGRKWISRMKPEMLEKYGNHNRTVLLSSPVQGITGIHCTKYLMFHRKTAVYISNYPILKSTELYWRMVVVSKWHLPTWDIAKLVQ